MEIRNRITSQLDQKTFDQVGAPRASRGGCPQKYFLDERGRKMICDLYDGSTERVDLLSRSLGFPRRIVKRFAMQLGKTKSRSWTSEQEDFLRQNIHKMPMNQLKIHLHKNRVTIIRKAHALGLYREYEGSGYTLADLARLFGFAEGATRSIYKWIEKGWLKGRRITVGFKVEQWEFSCKNIRDFVLSHPDQLNQHKFDWIALADILAGGEGIGRLDDQRESTYHKDAAQIPERSTCAMHQFSAYNVSAAWEY